MKLASYLEPMINLNYGLNRLGPWQCNALYLWQGFWDICVHATYVIQLLSCVYYLNLYIYNVIFQSNSSVVELCVPYPQHNFLIASMKLGESTCFSGALKRRWKQLNRQVCEVRFKHTLLTLDHGKFSLSRWWECSRNFWSLQPSTAFPTSPLQR